MHILNEVCYLTTATGATYFFYISQEHLKRSICQEHCASFTILVATIYIIITSSLWFIQDKLNEIII